MLTVLVIDESRARAGDICAGLALAGYQVAAILADTASLSADVERLEPDVILINADAPCRDTLENLAAMHTALPRPLVGSPTDDDWEVIRAAAQVGVSVYVIDALDLRRIKPIVEVARMRFADSQALHRELDEVSRRLSERKLVDRAKGVLIQARGFGEDAAYHVLCKLAIARGQTMAQAACDLLDMAQVLL